MTHRIQYIEGRIPSGVDPEDLDWQTVHPEPGIDYEDLGAVVREAAELDSCFERYSHRVITLESEPVDVVDPVTKCVTRSIVVTSQRVA